MYPRLRPARASTVPRQKDVHYAPARSSLSPLSPPRCSSHFSQLANLDFDPPTWHISNYSCMDLLILPGGEPLLLLRKNSESHCAFRQHQMEEVVYHELGRLNMAYMVHASPSTSSRIMHTVIGANCPMHVSLPVHGRSVVGHTHRPHNKHSWAEYEPPQWMPATLPTTCAPIFPFQHWPLLFTSFSTPGSTGRMKGPIVAPLWLDIAWVSQSVFPEW